MAFNGPPYNCLSAVSVRARSNAKDPCRIWTRDPSADISDPGALPNDFYCAGTEHEHIRSSDASARDLRFSLKRRSRTGLFYEQRPSSSYSPSMSPEELEDIIDFGNAQ